MQFRPKRNDTLLLNGKTFKFAEDSLIPGMINARAGTTSVVFKLIDETNRASALKVFNNSIFQTRRISDLADKIRDLASLSGLSSANRIILRPDRFQPIIAQFPDLSFAAVMPWVESGTWQELMIAGEVLTTDESISLAGKLVTLLVELESKKIAHGDLCGSNLVIDHMTGTIELVDLEDMFIEGQSRPEKSTLGSSGYSHTTAESGIWCVELDRFSGAVLLAEILGWCDANVRQFSFGESYFAPAEMQRNSERLKVLQKALQMTWGMSMAQAFQRAWTSRSLFDCPTLQEWKALIDPFRPQSSVAASAQENYSTETQPYIGQDSGGSRPNLNFVSHPSQPSRPKVSLHDLKAQMVEFSKEGKWQELLSVCDDILTDLPDEREVSVARLFAQRMTSHEAQFQEAWAKANFSGTSLDWRECQRLIMVMQKQAPQVEWYQKQNDQILEEVKKAQICEQAERLINEKRWREAQTLLKDIPSDFPPAAHLQTQIDMAEQDSAQIRMYLDQASNFQKEGKWSEVVTACNLGIAIGKDAEAFQGLLTNAYQQITVEEKLRQSCGEVESALDRYDYQKVGEIIEKMIRIRPYWQNVQELKARWQQQTDWGREVLRAKNAFDLQQWDEVVLSLEKVPDDFQDASILLQQAKDRSEWTQKVRQARQAFNLADMRALLATPPQGMEVPTEYQQWLVNKEQIGSALQQIISKYNLQQAQLLLGELERGHPQTIELENWIETEQERRRKIQEGMRLFNPELVMRALQDVDEQYPEINQLRNWANEETKRQNAITQALARYDTAAIEAILQACPENYANRSQLVSWLEHERMQARQIEEIRATYSRLSAARMLSEIPKDHPAARTLSDWLAQANQTQSEINAARETCDTAEMARLLVSLPGNQADLDSLQKWMDEENVWQQRGRRAMANSDLEDMQIVLERTSESAFYRKSWQDWLEKELVFRQNLMDALQDFRLEDLQGLIDQMPPAYPQRENWIEDLQREQTRSLEINHALQTFDADAMQQILETLPSSYPNYRSLLDWNEEEQKRSQQIAQARNAEDAERILQLLEDTPQHYPNRAGLLAWAKEEIERKQILQVAREQYDFVTVEKLLETMEAEYADRGFWVNWVNTERERAAKLVQARAAYDAHQVLSLLEDVSDGYPEWEDLNDWATQELQRQTNLREARASYDFESVEAEIEECPEDYPDYADWLGWARQVRKWRNQLQNIRCVTALDDARALLDELPTDMPDHADLAQWLSAEEERARLVEEGMAVYNVDQVRAAFGGSPAEDLRWPTLQAWLAQYGKMSDDLQQAVDAYLPEQLLALLENMPEAYFQRDNLLNWAENTQKFISDVAQAHHKGEIDQTFYLLDGLLLTQNPIIEEARAWTKVEEQRRSQFNEAIATHQVEQATMLLEQLDEKHAWRAGWSQQIENQVEWRKQVDKLSKQAQEFAAQGRWQAAAQFIASATAMGAPPEKFGDLQRKVDSMLLLEQQTSQAKAQIKTCLERKDIDGAVSAARLFGSREKDQNANTILWNEIRRSAALKDLYDRAETAEKKKDWRGSLAIWQHILELDLDDGRATAARDRILKILAGKKRRRLAFMVVGALAALAVLGVGLASWMGGAQPSSTPTLAATETIAIVAPLPSATATYTPLPADTATLTATITFTPEPTLTFTLTPTETPTEVPTATRTQVIQYVKPTDVPPPPPQEPQPQPTDDGS